QFPHLRLFSIQAQQPAVTRSFKDQFDDETLDVRQSNFLGLPTSKTVVPPPPATTPPTPTAPQDPHYKCYALSGSQHGSDFSTVNSIRTQFDPPETNREVRRAPAFACLPTLKTPTGTDADQAKAVRALQDKFPHIMCHDLLAGQIPQRQVDM